MAAVQIIMKEPNGHRGRHGHGRAGQFAALRNRPSWVGIGTAPEEAPHRRDSIYACEIHSRMINSVGGLGSDYPAGSEVRR